MLLPVKNKASFTLVELFVACHPKPWRRKATHGFTLIELLVVIAILGILSAAIIVAINPAKRSRQARDAKRKSDISAITNAIISYSVIAGRPPRQTVCDTSNGSGQSNTRCPSGPFFVQTNSWYVDNISPPNPPPAGVQKSNFEIDLVDQQGTLKNLPLDPKNDLIYYYQVEFRANGNPTTLCGGTATICDYWVGARLEDANDPLETGRKVFRCTDMPLAAGPGCNEVEFPNATGVNSYDQIYNTTQNPR